MNWPGGVDAAVEVDGGDHRFEHVGEQGRLGAAAGLGFAPAEQQIVAEAEPPADAGERGGRDERGLGLRLRAFRVVGELAIEQVGDDESEHRVAQELERLVVDDPAARVLGGTRLVRERVFEQAAVAEHVVQLRLDVAQLRQRRHDQAGAAGIAVAEQHAPGVGHLVLGHADPDLAERRDGEGEHVGRRSRQAHRVQPLTDEQPLHDRRFDLRLRAKDDFGVRHQASTGTTAVTGRSPAAAASTRSSSIVMSSCWPAPAPKARTSATRRSAS